jgi:transposase
MEEVFDGYYIFAAPYSPDLKPVERLFAEVKDLLRYREDEAMLHPIATICLISIFVRHSNLHSAIAENYFRIYREIHEMRLNEMAAP